MTESPLAEPAPRPRETQLLRGLDLRAGVGAEIGPLDRPVASKALGEVHYVDHCDTAALKARWASDPGVDVDALHVDAVWGRLTLRQTLADAGAFAHAAGGLDYVIASHVVEHVPDLVTWLAEVHAVLAAHGHLRLAVPDRRYTFDLLRRTSTLTEALDAYVRRRRTPSGSRVLDFALNMVHVDCGQAWREALVLQELVRGYSDEAAIALARSAEDTDAYHDVHCWVFTPRSFALLMAQLGRCRLLGFACEWLVPTAPDTYEFFASLRPEADHARVARSWGEVADALPAEAC
jgi:SAM-dependent methyltransferase